MTDAEVVRTRAQAQAQERAPLLVVDSLGQYLDAVGLGGRILHVERIGEGQSNVTYRIDLSARRVVLRRGPRPPFPPSTHDMLREARILRAVEDVGIPVPRVLAVCEDEDVIGVPFTITEFLDGDVITDRWPATLSTVPERRGAVFAVVDALAALHDVDVQRGSLASIGRPDGYLRRQVERFATLWPSVSRRSIPAVDTLAEWLSANLPASGRSSVVHGDYRMGNVMFAPRAPASVLAVLDWEMATLGDPLADLGYVVSTYAEAGAVETPLELTPVTRDAGSPTRADLIERYVERTGADVAALDWYRCLAMFKAAVFCEAIHTRWLDGERQADAFGGALATGVPVLLGEAAAAAEIDVDVHPD